MAVVTEKPSPPARPRTAWTGWAAFGVVIVALAGFSLWWAFAGGGDLEELADFVVSEPVSTVEVDSDAGSIRLIGSNTEEVTVTRTVRSGLREPNLTENLRGETLILVADCPSLGACSVDHEITAPSDVTVKLHTNAGDIEVENVTGVVDVDTNAGTIRLIGTSERIDAETNAGDVIGEGLSSTIVSVSTSAGSIRLDFLDPVEDIEATSNAGSVTIEVPGGPYRVDADTNVGNTSIDVPTDPDADARIVAETNAGNVTIRRP